MAAQFWQNLADLGLLPDVRGKGASQRAKLRAAANEHSDDVVMARCCCCCAAVGAVLLLTLLLSPLLSLLPLQQAAILARLCYIVQVKSVLAAGLFPNVLHATPGKNVPSLSQQKQSVAIHPSSFNHRVARFDTSYLVRTTREGIGG